MAVAAKQVIRRVVDILVDVGSVAWQVDELVRWLNDGQREIVIQRPDATAAVIALPLVAGFRQALPATAVKLLDIPCNTDGGPVRQETAELLLAHGAKPGMTDEWGVSPVELARKRGFDDLAAVIERYL